MGWFEVVSFGVWIGLGLFWLLGLVWVVLGWFEVVLGWFEVVWVSSGWSKAVWLARDSFGVGQVLGSTLQNSLPSPTGIQLYPSVIWNPKIVLFWQQDWRVVLAFRNFICCYLTAPNFIGSPKVTRICVGDTSHIDWIPNLDATSVMASSVGVIQQGCGSYTYQPFQQVLRGCGRSGPAW